MSTRSIEIVEARTHNLKGVSTQIPLGKLTVITGPSGSGKSSLAFDTLYAEGQRRFVESMSTYARQFVEKMERPDVEQIRNIQPAIAIEQKNRVKNARSTIGTATEISDYLRLLFAKAGTTICPQCELVVREDSPQSVTEEVLRTLNGTRIYVVAPVPRSQGVANQALRAELVRAGFTRIYRPAAPPPVLPAGKGKKAKAAAVAVEEAPARPFVTLDDPDVPEAEVDAVLGADLIQVVVDRAVADENDRDRISSSVSVAFQAGSGTCLVIPADAGSNPTPLLFHSGFKCNGCGRDFPRPEPNLFSFNSPLGACPKCSGFGRVTGVDWDKVFPNRQLTLSDEFVAPFNSPSYKSNYKWLRETVKAFGLPWDVPLQDLDDDQLDQVKYGAKGRDGVQTFFGWLDSEKYKVQSRILVARYRGYTSCPDCRGTRLVPDALNVVWGPADGTMPRRHMGQMSRMSIKDLLAEMEQVRMDAHEEELYGRIQREVLSRLRYLSRVGLDYLTLDRQTRTLSGGEAQRINLATALGTALTQTLYVLDEPTVGLHPRDSRRLLEILRDLRDKGNTLVVVEHDPEIILGSDRILDIGPGAGTGGGQIVFEGTAEELLKDGNGSLTARYLGQVKPRAKANAKRVAAKAAKARAAAPRIGGPAIRIVNARENNLKGVTVDIPLHRYVCISGVSGSGKTTLVHKILFQGWNHHAKRATEDMGYFDKIEGLDQLDEILLIDQSPIGRSIRSNPVTYVKGYDPIRKLMAATREARSMGITESGFSFNVAGGRCEACEGTGVTTYDMHFLAEVTLSCESCAGKRFSPRVLEVRFRDKNVDDILGMTVDDATEFFAQEKAVVRRLAPLREVGLGYITLGQNTSTLSGGEAQRLKLAAHLALNSGSGARTMMIFDEPTTGLHLSDLQVLGNVFRQLVEKEYSLVVIEHNLEIIRHADWVIDLGPEAGDQGGQLVAVGPPEVLADHPGSHTGRFLRELM